MSIEDAREWLEEAEKTPYSSRSIEQSSISQAHALIAIYDLLDMLAQPRRVIFPGEEGSRG